MGLDKIGDLDKIGGLRELEKLGLKGKQNSSTTSSTQEQRAFIDRLQTERIQEQRKNDEKRISEEKRKQEERRQQDEKKRLEEKQRKEDLFRQEEMKRQEEKRKKEEEEQKKKEIIMERLKKEEEARQMEKQRKVEEQRRLEEHRIKQENMRIEEQRRLEKQREFERIPNFEAQHGQFQEHQFHQFGPRDIANQLFGSEVHTLGARGLVGQVEEQLGALFGTKDKNSNQEPITKQGLNRPNRKNSPNQKTQEDSLKFEKYTSDLPSGIPSATPADKLPGFTPSREHKRQSHESHQIENRVRDRQTPLSVTGSENSHNSAPSGIPNELLDSILETAKLPVWKPPDKDDQQGFSPAKPPEPSPPKPAPVTSERDSSFDDLVRHIDSSPSHKDIKSSDRSSKHKILNKQQNKFKQLAQSDRASTSEAERSDFDDRLSMGGVDYDDPDDDLNIRKNSTKPEEMMTKRGTKVPCYAEKDEDLEIKTKDNSKLKALLPIAKGRPKIRSGRTGVFGGGRRPKYDAKAFEKVHKNLAGTDFDIENEFDDDFGASHKIREDLKTSMKDFREQTKKAPIYMQDKKSDHSLDFDEDTNADQIPEVPSDVEEDSNFEQITKGRPGLKLGKPRRGKISKELLNGTDTSESQIDTEQKEIPKVVISLKNCKVNLPIKASEKFFEDKEETSNEVIEKPEKSEPKIPKLKIKIGRTESPVEESEKGKKKNSVDKTKDHKEDSFNFDTDEDSQQQRIPKLKIKIGGGSKSSDKSVVEKDQIERNEFENDLQCETSNLIIRKTPSNSPISKTSHPISDERMSTSELALEAMKAQIAKSSPKAPVHQASNRLSSSSTSSPARKAKTSSDSADHLENAELQKIFGPDEPLQVNVDDESSQQNPGPEKGDEGPSELELLALELANHLAKEKQMKQQAEAAKRSKGDDEDDKGSSMHHHDRKYKFKQLNKSVPSDGRSSSPGPPTPVKINLTQNSVVDSNPLRRMRKKELLSQYYGIEPAPAPAPTPAPAPAPPQTHIPNGVAVPCDPSTQSSEPVRSHTREPVRMNIIKMPKAVASVTSVPTRADYQSQLEANMERKRKREGRPEDNKKSRKGKGGKNKDEEEPYKPKIKRNQEDMDGELSKEVRKTRGKPPKKCLAVDDSPERDPVENFIENKKNESLKYAEEILKSFDQDDKSGRKERRKDKKRRRRDNDDDYSQPNTKTPRIVIKFSKNKEPPKNIPKDNGLLKPPIQKPVEAEMQQKLPKLKIKSLIDPSMT